MNLVVETLFDVPAFDRARDQWEDLLVRADRSEMFLSHRWLAAWFRHFLADDGLRVLVVKDGTRWLGALPLIEKTRLWRGMRVRTLVLPVNQASGNLRGDFVVSESAAQVARALVAHLEAHSGEWECLELNGLTAGTPGFSALQESILKSTLRTTTWQVDQELYFLRVAGTWDDYLRARGRKFRRTLRGASNRFARAQATVIRTCRTPEELAAGLDAVFALDARSTKAGREGAVLLKGGTGEFYRTLAAKFGATNECCIDIICESETPIASLFTLYTRGTAFLLHIAHTSNAATISPGRMLLAHALERAWNDGLTEVDINGRTAFVQTWSETARALLRCKVYNHAARSRFAFWRDEVFAPARTRGSREYSLCPATPIPRIARGRAGSLPNALPRALRERSVEYYQDGRTALACGLACLRLAPGDEVLFPSYHCGSEFEVLQAKGLTLRYYAVPSRLEVDVATLECAITRATRAVYLIHYLGRPQDVAPIAAFCSARGLVLIEDCAQALYSGSAALPVGMLCDLAIFSLHKFLPVIDGGAAVNRGQGAAPPGERLGARDRLLLALRASAFASRCAAGRAAAFGHIGIALADAVWHFAGFAPITRPRAMSVSSRRHFYATDHAAVVGCRMRNYRQLQRLFSGLAGVEPFIDPNEEGFVPLLFPVWVDNPAPLLAALERAGIEAGLHWSALDARFPVEQFPEVVRLKAHLVVLPVHQDISEDAQARLARAVASLGYLPNRDTVVVSTSMERKCVRATALEET